MRIPKSRRLAALFAASLALAVPLGATTSGAENDAGRHEGGSQLRQVGYFIQWGIYGRSFFVKNLDTSGAAAKLTHVNYAFGNVGPQCRR